MVELSVHLPQVRAVRPGTIPYREPMVQRQPFTRPWRHRLPTQFNSIRTPAQPYRCDWHASARSRRSLKSARSAHMKFTPQFVFSHHRLSPDVPASGLIAYWRPAFQRQPPHRLLAAKLYELHHQLQQRDHKGRRAEHQQHHSLHIQTASPPSRRSCDEKGINRLSCACRVNDLSSRERTKYMNLLLNPYPI